MANEEKKVVITNQQWCDLMNRIHSGRSCLAKEALKLNITLDTLIAMGDEAHKGKGNEQEKEWRQTKRESAKRDKKMRLRKRKPATTAVPAPTSAPTPAPEPSPAPTSDPTPEPAPAPAASADPMEELLRRKEELQSEVAEFASSLEKAREILQIRQEALSDAQDVLEKAQAAVENAKSDVDEAQQVVRQAQARQAETQQALRQVEEEILRNQVYLIAPWYSEELPTFGTFISTVEMKGVQVLEAADTIEPDFKDMVSAEFDLGSEYMKALSFVSLVQEYILAEKKFWVLNTDPRVKKLMDKHIG